MKHPLIWLLKQMRRRIPALLLMTAAQVGYALFSVIFALDSKAVIDNAAVGDTDGFLRACLIQGGIILMILLCLTALRHLRDRLHADLERDWKQRLLHGLLHGEYAQVAAYHSGELLNRLNNDVAKVNEGILTILPSAAGMITRLVAAVFVLGQLDGTFTLLLLALGAAVVVLTACMRRRLKGLNKRVSEYDGKVSGFLQETLEKLLMVQAMDISAEAQRRADALMADRYAIQRKRKNVSLFANTGISILSYGVGFLALVWCARRMLLGVMSFGSVTAVIQLVSQLRSPFVQISGVMPKYVAMIASAERLMELDAIRGEPAADPKGAAELYGQMDALCARNLEFSYDRDKVLKNITFSLPKGSFSVITGPSGIGKSTLLKLLLGIFRAEGGELFADCGTKQVALDRSTRGLFAYVPQGNLLFSGSLRDNLTLVRPAATREEIDRAVHVSAMDEFLPQLPAGLDTVLGENGAGLSEGQAQRLAIARAILGGAPVLLLDECTSALDAQTEQTVLERLRALPGRTCIAVTHREAAISLCDLQLRMEDGTVRVIQNP